MPGDVFDQAAAQQQPTAWDINGKPVARAGTQPQKGQAPSGGDVFDEAARLSSSTPNNFPPGFVPDFPAGFVPDAPQGATAWDANGNPVRDARTQPPGAVKRFVQAAANNSPLGLIKPPEDSTEQVVHSVGGDSGLASYRVARGIVDSVKGIVTSKREEYQGAVSGFHQAVADAKSGKYGAAVTDALSGLGSAANMTMPPGIDPSGAMQEGSDIGKDIQTRNYAGAAGKVAGKAATVGTALLTPELGEEGAAAEETEGAATSVKTPGIVKQIVKGENVAQSPAQRALRGAANQAATDTGATATGISQPVRTLLDEPIRAVGKTERAAYNSINKAAGTDLKSLYDYRADLQDAIEDPTNITNRQKLTDELNQTKAQIQDGEAKAAANGVSPDVLNQAKRMTQQRYALQDVKKQLFNNESVISGNARYGADEQINVNAAIKNLEKLDKPSRFAPEGSPSRLRQALGDKAANQLFTNLYDAQRAGQQAIRARKVAAWVAAGVPIVGGTVELVKKATGN